MTSTGHSVRSRASSFVPLTEQEDGGCGAQLARRTHLRHLVNLSSQGGIVFNTGIVFESVCPSIGSHILITGVHQGINRLKDWEQQAISNVIVEDCTTPAFMDTIAKLNKLQHHQRLLRGGQNLRGCNGYVFRLEPSNGDIIAQDGLSGYGNHEISLDATLQHDTLNGYVFEFDSQGSIIGQNPLEGYGNHETRVCADNAAAGMLLVGINGYALGLKLSSFAPSYGPWMRRMAAKIGPKMLHQVALPGTHDSGTYGITLSSSVADDVSSWYKAASVNIWAGLTRNAIMKGWSIAQPLDIQHQLSSGIRYLDLRVQASKNVFTGNYSHNIVHSLFSVSIDDVLAQVDTFLSESGKENEVVLLDFNHFFNYDAAAHADLASRIKTQLNNKLAPASLTANVTLDQLWKSSGRVVTFYSDNTSVTQNDFLWSPKIISSPWPDMRTATDVLNFLDASVPVTAATF
ncbi:unnamed protein product, partial [Tilletia controversa]